MSARTALILGASGLSGSELLRILLESPDYAKIVSLGRNKVQADHPKLEQVIVPFDSLPDYRQYFHVDDVYCCLGTTIKKAKSKEAFKKVDFDYPLQAAKLAKANGVQQFLIISAMGADPNSSIFYNRIKGEVEQALQRLDLPALHIFRPSLLLGIRKEFRFGERTASVLMKLFSFAMIGPLRSYKAIEAAAVARAMYRTALNNAVGVQIYASDEIARVGGQA